MEIERHQALDLSGARAKLDSASVSLARASAAEAFCAMP